MLTLQPDIDDEECEFQPGTPCLRLGINADTSNTVLEHTQTLIAKIENLLQTPATSMFIRKRASNDKTGNVGPWCELRHHSSRLLSYQRAAEVLWDSGQMWPELFAAFEVIYVPSSSRYPNPLKANPQPASAIITRMATIEAKSKYLALAEELQHTVGLDELIEEEWTATSFRPVVHAEILLLNWLQRNGITMTSQFFNNWHYIGSSKPTCRLCDYYISSHPSRVQVRSSHGNLYRNWRMPDYSDVYGCHSQEEALKKRHEIMQNVMGRVRQDALRVLSEKVTDTKAHDSLTLSSLAAIQGWSGGQLEIQETDVSNADWSSVAHSEVGDDVGN
jgi:hypothetical protein